MAYPELLLVVTQGFLAVLRCCAGCCFARLPLLWHPPKTSCSGPLSLVWAQEKLPGFGCTCLSGSKCTPVASLLLRRRSVIVGAGYIAVEIAGILSTLGSKSSLLIRRDKVPLLASPTVPPVVAASQAAADLWWGSQESSGQEAERRRAAEPIPAATVRAESFCSSACQGTCFPEPRAESWPEERKIIMILKKKKKVNKGELWYQAEASLICG